MATRRRFMGRRGRSSLAVARRWTAQIVAESDFTASALFNTDIVQPTDYEQSTTLEPDSVTLVRIRGTVSLFNTGTVDSSAYMGIIVEPQTLSVAVENPNSALDLIDGKWLWTHVTLLPASMTEPYTFGIDVKAKRKLTNDDVRFKLVNGGDVIDIAAQFRCLLLGG